MSSTHRKKIVRALSARTGLTHQQALALVVAADENGTLPRPLDADGIRRAVDMLVAQVEEAAGPTPDTDGETPSRAAARAALETVGLDDESREHLLDALARPGLILFAGLVGTGKTVAQERSVRAWLAAHHGPETTSQGDSPVSPETVVHRDVPASEASFADLAREVFATPRVLAMNDITWRDPAEAAVEMVDEYTTALACIQATGYLSAILAMVGHGVDPRRLAETLTAIVVTHRDPATGAHSAEVVVVDDDVRALIRRIDTGPQATAASASTPVGVEDPADLARTADDDRVERPAPRADLNARLRDALEGPGLIVVAGPTGSGKSTVLYEAVRDRLRGKNRVITIEDPVEVRIHPEPDDQGEIMQRQIDHDHETFDDAFKYALRRDPDVLLVGEVRDRKHAAAVVDAASTGHLVLSGVHANGPSGVVHRLIRLGVAPERVAATLEVVVTTWHEGGQFYSTTWPVTDDARVIIRNRHALSTFDAELRRAFGEEPAPETSPPASVSRTARTTRSERVLDVIKGGPDKRPSINHVLVTPPCGNLLLTGPTGSGKSVIARQAAAMHRSRGDRVIVIDAKGGTDYESLDVEVITEPALGASVLAAFGPGNPVSDQRTLIVVEEVRSVLGAGDPRETSKVLRSIMAASATNHIRIIATSQVGIFSSPSTGLSDAEADEYVLLPRDFDTRVLLGRTSEDHWLRHAALVDPQACRTSLAQGWAFVESDRCPAEAVNLWGKDEDKTMRSTEQPLVKAGLGQVAVMLHVGVPAAEAFAQAAASAGKGEAAKVFARIGDGLQRRRSTGEAALTMAGLMAAEPHAFAPWVVKTVETAEERWRAGGVTGDARALPAAFERIADAL